ncbi:MAG: DNRLRE domain-containing protein [Phycisphaerae bacterium]|nr:DNRLRE domain-containing protein [Phycisphaerae bacterium]
MFTAIGNTIKPSFEYLEARLLLSNTVSCFETPFELALPHSEANTGDWVSGAAIYQINNYSEFKEGQFEQQIYTLTGGVGAAGANVTSGIKHIFQVPHSGQYIILFEGSANGIVHTLSADFPYTPSWQGAEYNIQLLAEIVGNGTTISSHDPIYVDKLSAVDYIKIGAENTISMALDILGGGSSIPFLQISKDTWKLIKIGDYFSSSIPITIDKQFDFEVNAWLEAGVTYNWIFRLNSDVFVNAFVGDGISAYSFVSCNLEKVSVISSDINSPHIINFSNYGSPYPVVQGGQLLLSASASDLNGSISQVEFYLDSNNNGVLDLEQDNFLGLDTNPSGGSYDWLGTVTWEPGSYRFFARAQDNDGVWSESASTVVTVGANITNPSVSPGSGDTCQSYAYRVDYFDPSGMAPIEKKVYIDNNPYNMVLESGNSAHGTYIFVKNNLSAGDHNYRFSFKDSAGNALGTEIYTGPTVNEGGVFEGDTEIKVRTYSLDGVSISGNGGSIEPAILSSERYSEGDVLYLTAYPDYGWEVDHWQTLYDRTETPERWYPINNVTGNTARITIGHCINREGYNPVQMIEVYFRRINANQRILHIDTSGPGSVNLADGPHEFSVGQQVQLSAIPTSEAHFVEWKLNGEFFSDQATVAITMDGANDKQLKAVFAWDETVEYTISLPCIADATLKGDSPDKLGTDGRRNKGDYAELKVEHQDGQKLQEAIFKFDVSQIPDGARITSVELILYCKEVPSNRYGLEIQRNTSDWDEETITSGMPSYDIEEWNYAEKIKNSITENAYCTLTLTDYGSIDILDWIENYWRNGENYGLRLKTIQVVVDEHDYDDGEWEFVSTEDPDGTKHPVLRVTYEGQRVVPQIATEIDSICVETVKGADDSDDVVFNVWNEGTGKLEYAVQTDQEWLIISDGTTGSSNGEQKQITVHFDSTSLSYGYHTANIIITDTNAEGDPLIIPVTFGVMQPVISANPTEVEVQCRRGENPGDTTIDIWNGSLGTLNYTIENSSSWLLPNFTGGTLTTTAQSIILSFGAGALDAGIYTDTLIIRDVDNNAEPLSIPVSLSIYEQVATPTFSPDVADTYIDNVVVSISCETEGAIIRYTTDGSAVTSTSSIYDGNTIELTKSTILRARGWKDGMWVSNENIASYKVQPDAPELNLSEDVSVYNENANPIIVAPELNINDPENRTIFEAKVEISGNFIKNEDVLSGGHYTWSSSGGSSGSIYASYNSENGILTLSRVYGQTDASAFENALRSVTYVNTSDNPNVLSRAITFSVFDGENWSDPATKIVDVSAVNDRPTVQGQSLDIELGQAVVVNLAGEDVETDYSDLIFNITAGPGHGLLENIGQGQYRYTPEANFTGEDGFTYTVTDTGDPAGTPGNALTSLPATVTLNTGYEVQLDARGRYQYTDASGDRITIQLAGPGAGMLYFAHQGNCDLMRLILAGTTSRSRLTIFSRYATTTIEDIVVEGSLYSLIGTNVDLLGDIDISGNLQILRLRNVADDHHITIGPAANARQMVSMIFGSVQDLIINSAMPIRTLIATEWLDTDGSEADSINAPWIGILKITGDRRNPKVNGNFQANLNLSGLGAIRYTLISAYVAGNLTNADWNIAGQVSTIYAAGIVNGWSLNGGAGQLTNLRLLRLGDVQSADVAVTGNIGYIIANRWLSGNVQAGTLGTLYTTGKIGAAGDFLAELNLTGKNARYYTLTSACITGDLKDANWNIAGQVYSIYARGMVDGWSLDGGVGQLTNLRLLRLGNVQSANVAVAGNVSSIIATQWLGGKIEAKSVQNLRTTGLVGTFSATVTLSGSANPRLITIGSVYIAGNLTNSQWNVTGMISRFLVRGTARDSRLQTTGDIRLLFLGASHNSNYLAGVDKSFQGAFSEDRNDFVNESAKIWLIRILGLRGTAPATRYVTDTHFTAGKIGGGNILNADLGSVGFHILDREGNISYIRHIDIGDRSNSWFWRPGKPLGNDSLVNIVV